MVPTVENTIENIRKTKSDDQFLDVTLTLLKLIQNVLGNPDKPKFKKIKRNTAFFFTNPGVEDFLMVCGFEVCENWMVFLDTEVAFLMIDTGKRQLLSYRKKVNSLKAYEVPENSLRYSAIMLGKGKFASVFQGTWENCPVAIKALHPYCTSEAVADFRREAELLRSLKHNNIIILYAVCLQNVNKRHAHVLELMDRTILDVLRTDPDISTEKLVAKALEVAAGLDHIHSKNILHCDIAARNILLNKQGIVKISDFGLARYADSPDCYLTGKTTVFPIRWTAPEVFTENVLTKASDVWSYGILCYEFITRGKTPYGTFQNRQIKSKVSTGYRLPKSQECPEDLYMLMLKCWNAEPNKRPLFQNIYQDLINMKLDFAKKQRFAVCFDSKEDQEAITHEPTVSAFRRQSSGVRASIRRLVRSVSGKRPSTSWSGDSGEESLIVYTTLLQTSISKVTIHCKKDTRANDVLKKTLNKIGFCDKDSYKYALVEIRDPRSGIRRSQPALNATMESCTPYVKLRGLMDQPIILRSEWQYKDHTRYMMCPRGAIHRAIELTRSVQEGGTVGHLPYETRGYLLQCTGIVSGRHSMMFTKVWGALDGVSLGVFEDEDCEDTWDNGTVLTVEHACISEMRSDMFTLTDVKNVEHSFQADDNDDAYRWVEAINAAQSARAPQSNKLTESTTLHTGKVLIMTEVEPDSTLNYGHKQITLRKDEVFFYHNGNRLSEDMGKVLELDIVPGNHGHGNDNTVQPNGFRLLFTSITYRLYPSSHDDFYAWSTAFHKAIIFLGRPEVIQNSNLNQIKMLKGESRPRSKTADDITCSVRSGSPDSGILSGDSIRVTTSQLSATPSPDIEDSFSELNRSMKVEAHSISQQWAAPVSTDGSIHSRSASSPLPLPPTLPPTFPPPLPPRNKPFGRTISSPSSRPLPAIPAQTT